MSVLVAIDGWGWVLLPFLLVVVLVVADLTGAALRLVLYRSIYMAWRESRRHPDQEE